MSKSIRLVLIIALITLATLGTFLIPGRVLADAPADVLESYTVSIVPESDGALSMHYELVNYCTYSDWPTDQPYLQVGVPTYGYNIVDWGPKDGNIYLINAESQGQLVQLDFDQANLPKNGDCFNLSFSVLQPNMAHVDPSNQNITYEFFAAGWNFPIQVKKLTINWALPVDKTTLKLTDPTPLSQDAKNMTWSWKNPQMDNSQMFSDATIKLAYVPGTFTLPVTPPVQQPVENTGGGSNNGGQNFLVIFLIAIVVIVVVCVIVGFAIGALNSGDDSLGSDSKFTVRVDDPPVHYYSRPSPTSYVSTPARPSYASQPVHHVDPPSYHSPSGGFGGSSGHSSGCASMPSCACACACAGGGKVGCMLKMLGIKIGCMKKIIAEMTQPSA